MSRARWDAVAPSNASESVLDPRLRAPQVGGVRDAYDGGYDRLDWTADETQLLTPPTSAGDVSIIDTLNGQSLIQAETGGPIRLSNAVVRIANDVRLLDSTIRGAERIVFSGDASYDTPIESGGTDLRIRDGTNNTNWLWLAEGAAPQIPNFGPNGTGALQFANTQIYEDANGEIVVQDSGGTTTTIS